MSFDNLVRSSLENQNRFPSWIQEGSGIPEYNVTDDGNIHSNYSDAIGNKRKRLDFHTNSYGVRDGDIIDDAIKNDGKSKRFVWPDFLHNEFVAAVFDVGLRFANSEPLPGLSFYQYQDAESAEFLAERLRKIQHFRGIMGATGKTVKPSTNKEKGHRSKKNEILKYKVAEQAKVTREAEIIKVRSRMARLRGDLEKMSNAINIQMTHLASLRSSFDRQIKIHSDMQTRLGSVEQILCKIDSYAQAREQHHDDPLNSIELEQRWGSSCTASEPTAQFSTSVNFPPHNLPSSSSTDDRSDEVVRYLQRQLQGGSGSESSSSRQPHFSDQSATFAGRNGSANFHPNIRDELPLIAEMRAHMDMHRQLLMRRDDQLAMHQHSSHSSSSATGNRSQRAGSDGGPDRGSSSIGNHRLSYKDYHQHRNADLQIGDAGEGQTRAGGGDKDGDGIKHDSGFAAGSVWTYDDDGNGDLDENLFAFLLDS